MAESLCLNCSLCCDGTLYKRLAVTEEEIERLNGRGEFFTKPDGALRMRLGCANLAVDGACQVYEDRPRICKRYRCNLLRKVDAGEVEETHAVEIVRDIRSIASMTRVRAHQAMGEDAPAKTSGTIHDVVKRLNNAQKGSKLSDPYVHAMFAYDHLVKLIRLHLKADFSGGGWPE